MDVNIAERRSVMRVLSRAGEAEIDAALGELGWTPAYVELRKPEIGLVMLRGRIGGDGAPFNIGEATVTRAAIRIATGEVGHSYILGRSPEKARNAALVDAMCQNADYRQEIERKVLATLRRAHDERSAEVAAKTAATKVDFFTLVRGEDA